MIMDSKEIVKKLKANRKSYNEDYHCDLLVKTMLDPEKGTMFAFLLEAFITETTFYNWIRTYEAFEDVYSFCKIYTRHMWEQEGRKIKDKIMPIGQTSFAFEHWKMVGWSRFGISKNSRIKLNLDPNGTPDKHYSQLLKQASQGDFTAAEIKQLMEAVNVGLNTHQAFELQREIDELKADLATMQANTNGHNSRANKRTS